MKMVFVSPILLLSLGWQNQQSVLFLKIERQSRKRMLQEEWQLLLNKDHRRLKKKLRTCAQSTVVKVEISNHLGSRNGLIHFTLIPMGKIVSFYEHFGLRTTFRNELSSWTEVWLYMKFEGVKLVFHWVKVSQSIRSLGFRDIPKVKRLNPCFWVGQSYYNIIITCV